MNWKTYKGMNLEQKEEYDFRFKDRRPQLNITGLVSWSSIFLFMTNMLLYTSYLFLVGEHFVEFKDSVQEILVSASRIVSVIGSIIIISLIYDAIHLTIFIILKKRWLNKNKIMVYNPTLDWIKLKWKRHNGRR